MARGEALSEPQPLGRFFSQAPPSLVALGGTQIAAMTIIIATGELRSPTQTAKPSRWILVDTGGYHR